MQNKFILSLIVSPNNDKLFSMCCALDIMCFYPLAKYEPATRLTMPGTMTKWIINEKLISRTLLIYVFLSDPKDVSAFSLKEKKCQHCTLF